MKQQAPAELVDGLSAYFPRSDRIATAWGNLVSNYLLLRNLRLFVPFTSVDENGDAYDLSGQGRVLNNNNAITYASTSIMTYANLVKASSQFFNRPDEAGLDITGQLTIGGWFWFNALGAQEGFVGKYNTNGVNQRVYLLYKTNVEAMRFIVSSNGTATTTVTSTVTGVNNNWYFMVGRYTPSTELAVWVNGTKTTNLVAIPASLSNQASSFWVGQDGSAGGSYLGGRAALVFLCATALEDCFINALFWHSAPWFGVKP